MKRRGFLKGGLAAAIAAIVPGTKAAEPVSGLKMLMDAERGLITELGGFIYSDNLAAKLRESLDNPPQVVFRHDLGFEDLDIPTSEYEFVDGVGCVLVKGAGS